MPEVKTPVGDAPVIPLGLILIGGYLAWFGIHYFKSGLKWPSDPIKSVLQGKGLPAATPALSSSEQAVEAAAQAQLAAGQGVTPGTGQANPNAVGQAVAAGVGSSTGDVQQNIAIGQMLATSYGWGTGDNWLCLKTGWQEESGWSATAANVPSDPYNHAYGIPQANPGTKMAAAGPNWKTDPTTQIKWGLSYIRSTYGSPSQVPGWTPNGPAAGYVGY